MAARGLLTVRPACARREFFCAAEAARQQYSSGSSVVYRVVRYIIYDDTTPSAAILRLPLEVNMRLHAAVAAKRFSLREGEETRDIRDTGDCADL